MKKIRYVVTASIDVELTVSADSYEAAAASIPHNASAQSVRLESEPHESRMAVVSWCCFCQAPILFDDSRDYYTGILVPMEKIPEANRTPFFNNETESCCRRCASEKGF